MYTNPRRASKKKLKRVEMVSGGHSELPKINMGEKAFLFKLSFVKRKIHTHTHTHTHIKLYHAV